VFVSSHKSFSRLLRCIHHHLFQRFCPSCFFLYELEVIRFSSSIFPSSSPPTGRPLASRPCFPLCFPKPNRFRWPKPPQRDLIALRTTTGRPLSDSGKTDAKMFLLPFFCARYRPRQDRARPRQMSCFFSLFFWFSRGRLPTAPRRVQDVSFCPFFWCAVQPRQDAQYGVRFPIFLRAVSAAQTAKMCVFVPLRIKRKPQCLSRTTNDERRTTNERQNERTNERTTFQPLRGRIIIKRKADRTGNEVKLKVQAQVCLKTI